MNIFQKRISETFDTIMDSISPFSGSSQSVKVISKFSSVAESSQEVQNFLSINKYLTSKYGSYNSIAQKLYWNYDDVDGMDRYVWSGEFQKNNTEYKFTYTNIEGRDVDGYMMIPSPYAPFDESLNLTTHENPTTDSFTIKLKFNNLQPNTFVPLFGYALGDAGHIVKHGENVYKNGNQWVNPAAFKIYSRNTNQSNSSYYYWTFGAYNWDTKTWDIDYQGHSYTGSGSYTLESEWVSGVKNYGLETFHNYPAALAHSENNVYGISTNDIFSNLPSVKNSITWFLYAHDGQGNGIVVTTAGETSEVNKYDDPFRPSNEWFGQYNGFLKYKQPTFLEDWFIQGKTISDLALEYSIMGEANTPESYKGQRIIHVYDIFDSNSFDDQSTFTTNPREYYKKYSSISDSDVDYVYSSINKEFTKENAGNGFSSNVFSQSYHETFNALVGNPNSNIQNFSLGKTKCNVCQVVAFGQTQNANLSQVSEIKISATRIGLDQKMPIGIGMTDTATTNSAGQVMFDGEIADLRFDNIYGTLFYDSNQQSIGGSYSCWRRFSGWINCGYSISRDWRSGPGPGAIILRPTVEGQGEIHEVHIGSKDNNDVVDLYSYNSTTEEGYYLRDYYTKTTAGFYVPEKLAYYNAIKDASTSPAIMEDPASNWKNKSLLFDATLGTKIECEEPGYEKPLIIPLSSANTSIADSIEVENIRIDVRNVQLFSLSQFKLRASILDQNKNIILTSGGNSPIDLSSPDIIPLEFAESYPNQTDYFSIFFEKNPSAGVTYGDVKNGYLKLWVEQIL